MGTLADQAADSAQPSAAPELRGKRIAFAGRLAALSRAAANAALRSAGAIPVGFVTRRTALLVIGLDGFPLGPDGSPNASLRRAEELIAAGLPLRIIPETTLLELLGLRERRAEIGKSLSADTVCSTAGVTAELLARWEQFDLVRAADGRYDFRDVVSLRAIAELVSAGVRLDAVARGIRGLRRHLPDVDRPLAQLRLIAAGPRELLADFEEYRLAPDGQLLLNFDLPAVPTAASPSGAASADHARAAASRPSPAVASRAPVPGEPQHRPALGDARRTPAGVLNADEWLDTGRRWEEEQDWPQAERAYRQALAVQPAFPEAHFNLGNVLRSQERLAAAAECYAAAVKTDERFAPAWYNLADVYEEQGRLAEAIACLRRALRADPDFADAHFNLAAALEALGDAATAREHWQAYLRYDPASEWAQVARARLAARLGQDC